MDPPATAPPPPLPPPHCNAGLAAHHRASSSSSSSSSMSGADLSAQLHQTARDGNAEGIEACLAAGADANAVENGRAPLFRAARSGSAACVRALLAAGARPNTAVTSTGWTALHCAAAGGTAESVALLLAAGASPSAVTLQLRWTALHIAAGLRGDAACTRLLLQAGPSMAVARDRLQQTPLDLAVKRQRLEAALCLLAEPRLLQPVGSVLATLAGGGAWALPLYATLATHRALTAPQWGQLPAICPGLGAALPAVLQRSPREAALLVCHLAPAERRCLHMAALCLAQMQRATGLQLPIPIVWRVLALSAAD